MKRLVLAALLLSGCAGISTAPVPQAARLTNDLLTVTLTDATVCRADWAKAGGAGHLDGCGLGYDYSVTVDQHPNILRQWMVELALALRADQAVPPLATVVLTDAAGKSYTFTSPPPAAE